MQRPEKQKPAYEGGALFYASFYIIIIAYKSVSFYYIHKKI